MSRMRKIRRHAPALLEAAKESLRYFLRGEPLAIAEEEAKRQKLIAHLRRVIEEAEPADFDENLSSLKLVMTHPTAKVLLAELENRAGSNHQDRLVLESVQEGLRSTKQRMYMTLTINHAVLRRLVHVLNTTSAPAQDKVFKRLAVQIEEEGLSKNPMEVLAKSAL